MAHSIGVKVSPLKHLEWEILATPNYIDDFNNLKITVTVERQGQFYATFLIFPLLLLNVLSLVIFTLPVSTTERQTFAMTLMLTYFVLLVVIIDSSPPTGNQMPLLGLYIMLCTCIVVSTFGMSLLLIEIYEHCRLKKRKMPTLLSDIVERYCCIANGYKDRYGGTRSTDHGIELLNFKGNTDDANDDIGSNNNTNHNLIQKEFKQSDEYEVLKWRVCSDMLNKLFFCITAILHIVLPIVLYTSHPHMIYTDLKKSDI